MDASKVKLILISYKNRMSIITSIIIFILIFFLLPYNTEAQASSSHSVPIRIENLGPLVESTTLEHRLNFYLPIIGQTHLILYYVNLDYHREPFIIVDINLDGQEIKTAKAVCGRPGPVATLLHSNGLIYIGSGAPGYFMVYDPETGQSRQIAKLADNGAQFVIEGDDRAIYIGECTKGYVERYDPQTGAWENYGIIDDPGPPYYRYAYTLGADGRYVYIAMGQRPWYLVILDRQTRKQEVFWKDQENANVTVFRGQDGKWYASRTLKGSKKTFFRLREGKPELTAKAPPAAPQGVPLGAPKPPAYEIDLSQAVPDSSAGGRAIIRWRKQGSPEWRQVSATLRLSPFDIKRLYPSPDGRHLGFTSFYGPVFSFDVQTKSLKILGRPQRSLYDAVFAQGEWFFVGYPSATLRYNPEKPWNLSASSKDLSSPLVNPRLISVAPEAAAKYHYYVTTGSDGFIYFGGHHERNAVGGSLGWYHPKTQVTGGLREPFLKHDVSDLIAVDGGRKIIFSSHGVDKGVDGRIFIFDTQQKKLTDDFAPLPGIADAGKLLEVEPGIVIGVVSGTPQSFIYQADLKAKKMIGKKGVPGRAFGAVKGFDRRLAKGPDGYIWFYVDNFICRLNPKTLQLEKVLEAPPAGNLIFVGSDLYIYGHPELRKITGLSLENH